MTGAPLTRAATSRCADFNKLRPNEVSQRRTVPDRGVGRDPAWRPCSSAQERQGSPKMRSHTTAAPTLTYLEADLFGAIGGYLAELR